jgi:hypothetical protein
MQLVGVVLQGSGVFLAAGLFSFALFAPDLHQTRINQPKYRLKQPNGTNLFLMQVSENTTKHQCFDAVRPFQRLMYYRLYDLPAEGDIRNGP